MRYCNDCKEIKILSDFHKNKNTKDGYACYCKSCTRIRSLDWQSRKSSKIIIKARMDRYRSDKGFREREQKLARIRIAKNFYKATKIYGFKCQNCGNKDFRLFEFHHVNGQETKINEDYSSITRRIIKANKKLTDLQLLCANCHKLANLRDGTWSNNKNKIIEELIREEQVYL